MSDSTSLMQQYRAMPRVVQWGALAAVGIGLFFLWSEYLQPVADTIDRKSEAILNKVQEVRSSKNVASEFQANSMRDVVHSLGPVEVPGTENLGAAALNVEVNRITQAHGASNYSFGYRSRGNLNRAALPDIARGKRIERLSGDLKFEATPKAAAAILADLESSAEIESVSSVRMTREGSGKVKVQLTIEAWVISSDSGSSGPAGSGGTSL